MSTIFLSRARYVPKRAAYYSDHGDHRVLRSRVPLFAFRDGCTSVPSERGRGRGIRYITQPVQLLTLAGEGPLTKGGGARFFGLARGSSSWGAGPACLARFLRAAAKLPLLLLLFCCPPGPGPGVWPWGSTPELGRWDLPIEVGWALVLAGCRPERRKSAWGQCSGPCEIYARA